MYDLEMYDLDKKEDREKPEIDLINEVRFWDKI